MSENHMFFLPFFFLFRCFVVLLRLMLSILSDCCVHMLVCHALQSVNGTHSRHQNTISLILPLLRSLNRIISEVSYQMRVSKLSWSILYDVKISRSKGSQTISSSGNPLILVTNQFSLSRIL